MTAQRILLVEDELVLAEIVCESLQSRGFNITHTPLAADVVNLYYKLRPDIIILDVMLPDGDGFAVARQLRNIDMEVPIIFLTSRSLPKDVVQGFESGGNDYLKKPFSLEELIVRIKALLSKNRLLIQFEATVKATQLGKYLFQYPEGVLSLADSRRALTSRESEILQLLILNKNQVLSRNTILVSFWGGDDYFTGRSLDVFMAKLRKYLIDDPAVSILNIRGQGYKLVYDGGEKQAL